MKKEMWPVMLTPYTEEGAVDYASLERLIAWYEANGVSGLFAVCQSSEMFSLSLRERVDIARFVKEHAHVPVIASGHVSTDRADQLDELRRVADTGVDAVVLISNRMAPDREGPDVWKKNLEWLLERLPESVPLGIYECPAPYKWLLSDEELAFCAGSGRFRFMKDTCCDLATLKRRAAILSGTPMRRYNANIATLLDSLRAGCAGFSGVMANFHPDLFAWLLENYERYPAEAERLQAALTMCALIERQCYPVNAKYHLRRQGVFASAYSRVRNQAELTETFKDEVRQMERLADYMRSLLPR